MARRIGRRLAPALGAARRWAAACVATAATLGVVRVMKGAARVMNGAARVMTVFGVAAVTVAAFGAMPAWAGVNHPTGAYARFAECPLGDTAANDCMFSAVTGGEVIIGKRLVPIGATIALQGGLHIIERPEGNALEVLGAENGATLTSVALPVPGGLLGLVNPALLPLPARESADAFLHAGANAVTATLELARPADQVELSAANLIDREATALQLPVKVKLGNPFLGSACYVGSDAQPIVLNLTTGATTPAAPNQPIKGTLGQLSFAGGILAINGSVLADNDWAAPAASGCGGRLASLVDPILDASIGLPAKAGRNTAILDVGTLALATAQAVRESE